MPKAYSVERLEKRIPMAVAVQLAGHQELPGLETTFTENVSPGGARVLTVRRWKPNESLWLAAHQGDFRARARVAYCQPLRAGGYAVGLEFLQPTGQWVVAPADFGDAAANS